MADNERELILKNEVFAIVGATMEVSNELGAGFLEAVYQEALGIELTDRGIPCAEQLPIGISYKGRRRTMSKQPRISANHLRLLAFIRVHSRISRISSSASGIGVYN